jgi:hypothetical protein
MVEFISVFLEDRVFPKTLERYYTTVQFFIFSEIPIITISQLTNQLFPPTDFSENKNSVEKQE